MKPNRHDDHTGEDAANRIQEEWGGLEYNNDAGDYACQEDDDTIEAGGNDVAPPYKGGLEGGEGDEEDGYYWGGSDASSSEDEDVDEDDGFSDEGSATGFSDEGSATLRAGEVWAGADPYRRAHRQARAPTDEAKLSTFVTGVNASMKRGTLPSGLKTATWSAGAPGK